MFYDHRWCLMLLMAILFTWGLQFDCSSLICIGCSNHSGIFLISLILLLLIFAAWQIRRANSQLLIRMWPLNRHYFSFQLCSLSNRSFGSRRFFLMWCCLFCWYAGSRCRDRPEGSPITLTPNGTSSKQPL